MNTSTRYSSSFVGSFPNTPDGHLAFKNLSATLHRLSAAAGIKYRIRRYGRGKNRRALRDKLAAEGHWLRWQKLGWSATRSPALTHFRPPIKFCERFDVYVTHE